MRAHPRVAKTVPRPVLPGQETKGKVMKSLTADLPTRVDDATRPGDEFLGPPYWFGYALIVLMLLVVLVLGIMIGGLL